MILPTKTCTAGSTRSRLVTLHGQVRVQRGQCTLFARSERAWILWRIDSAWWTWKRSTQIHMMRNTHDTDPLNVQGNLKRKNERVVFSCAALLFRWTKLMSHPSLVLDHIGPWNSALRQRPCQSKDYIKPTHIKPGRSFPHLLYHRAKTRTNPTNPPPQ